MKIIADMSSPLGAINSVLGGFEYLDVSKQEPGKPARYSKEIRSYRIEKGTPLKDINIVPYPQAVGFLEPPVALKYIEAKRSVGEAARATAVIFRYCTAGFAMSAIVRMFEMLTPEEKDKILPTLIRITELDEPPNLFNPPDMET